MTLLYDLAMQAEVMDGLAAQHRVAGKLGSVVECEASAARLREHAKRLREHMEQSDWRVRAVSEAVNGGALATQEKP